jgi:DNA-binding CsgD family transcriptional regulator
VIQGKRDVEIAGILGLAAPTVSWHVHHVLAKLGATSRSALLATLPTGA